MESWEALSAECARCEGCELCHTRHELVFGVGDKNARLMFIGEGPGEQEDLRGEPFVGPAGQLLDRMLEIIYLRREDVYITNIVKCRPPRNRDPLPAEQNACIGWLRRQIALVDPEIIVFLGRIAACYFLGKDFKISHQHGQFYDWDGRRVIALYHPSALLRDPAKRPETFVDLKTLKQELDKSNA